MVGLTLTTLPLFSRPCTVYVYTHGECRNQYGRARNTTRDEALRDGIDRLIEQQVGAARRGAARRSRRGTLPAAVGQHDPERNPLLFSLLVIPRVFVVVVI